MQASLTDSLQYLKTVGPRRAEQLAKAGLRTARDLLFYFPTRYLDRTTLLTSGQAATYVENGFNGEITVIGKVVASESRHFGKKQVLIVTMRDSTGFFELVWFQGAKYFENKFIAGQSFAVSAKPSISKFGSLQFAHPDFDRLSDDENQVLFNTGKIIPFYRIPAELRASNFGDLSFRKIITVCLELYTSKIEETLPAQLIAKHRLMPLRNAVQALHFPESNAQIEEARRRLKYEELFFIEVLVASRKNNYREQLQGVAMAPATNLLSAFIQSLPFQLTSAQLHCLTEIKAGMAESRPMNRLLQGDVGSGKTIVALIAMLIAVDSGKQAALMVPTEILADQHARNISRLLQGVTRNGRSIRVELLLGGQKKSIRSAKLELLALQDADIVIGTHALFEEDVAFRALGLVVIDEQHRFGVVQRARLMAKGITPDLLLMSATPIPRTLSMTVYGDLDVSVINQMPKNRLPIKTHLRGETKLPDIYRFIIDKAADGVQSFIVYPLVQESEKLELKAAEQYYEELRQSYFSGLRVGLIHGKMKWQQKEEIMLLFAAKQFDVLLATTVIEVGIDIPDANIILINDAFRFGLSQLHQLRGRVGRGTVQAHCILVAPDALVASSARITGKLDYLSPAQLEKYRASVRLQTMVQYTDGFKIAEMDMKLRGPGDIFGIKQSGFPDLRFADLTEDHDVILTAKEDAFAIIAADPHLKLPENALIRRNLIEHYSENLKYAKIS